jgi:hypothetical protein
MLAFKGWEGIPEPWTYVDCKKYIEWCHINKKFLQSGIERINIQKKHILSFACVLTPHNNA